MGILDKFKDLRSAYDDVKSAGSDPFSVRFDKILSPTEGIVAGKKTILLGTNNYLGLTFDKQSVETAVTALRENGTGTTGSRIANGSYGWHARLERDLAAFFGRKHAMMFTTGYQANLGIIATLAGRDDHLVIDADSHACIYDACKLTPAPVTRFKHNDPDDLRTRLRRLKNKGGNVIVVTEGIFSMLGDKAPLKEIVEVTKEFGAYLIVDEAHSMGVLGKHGRGLAEECGVEDDVDFIVGTFSKSLGAIGGFCVSNIDDFDLLKVACRPYMFTASLPSSVVASVVTSLEKVKNGELLREKLMGNARRLYDGMAAAGFSVGPDASPVVAVQLPSPEMAIAFWNALLNEGLYVNLALPPATPANMCLLRSSVSAAHSHEQIDQAIALFTKIGLAFGVIEPERIASFG
ncbi:serine palmitoyltransferase [Tateyamaria pelophila]|uniref:serine palmitoyltransferase n=1 Tax=Tateyamaria pelophila TaxID=328415 RepID=UPI001CBC8052|nr:pyridoxal phosphate-dependent aminotransferase family protein [Tateyamaria pelophila]